MYKPGDIIVNFHDRTLFEMRYENELKEKRFYRVRLATPGETSIYQRCFPGKKSVTFSEFKKEMPVFDGRRRRGSIYGYIEMNEGAFLFFREMRYQLPMTNEEKLSDLIFNYQRADSHNKKPDQSKIKLAEMILSMVSDLQKVTE